MSGRDFITLDDLVDKLYDGNLSAEDERRLVAALADPDNRGFFVEAMTFQTALRKVGMAGGASGWTKTNRATGRRMMWAPLAAAAGLLAALGIGFWLSRTGPAGHLAHGPVARVESVQGSALGIRDATPAPKRWALKAGDEIREGTRIETGEDGAVKLAWLAEAATVELAENSKFETRNSKLAFLRQGRLTAQVAKQPTDRPFEVETPHALATALGTRFRLEVRGGTGGPTPDARPPTSDPQQSTINNQQSTIPSTWLHVEEGLVRYMRLADQESLDVAADRFAVVGENDAAFALKTYPADAEWVDGPVIFRDDFEQGLDGWRIFLSQRQPDGRFREIDASPEDLARVRIRAEEGRTPGSSALDMHHAFGSDIIATARPLADATSKDFMVELYVKPLESFGLDCFHGSAKTQVENFPICPEQKKKAQNSIRKGVWYFWRQEYRLRVCEEGRISMEGKSLHNGFMSEHFRYEQMDEYFLAMTLRLGRVLIDNYVVRELIAVGNPQETQLPSGGTP